jgi:hypothetical protein
LWTSRRTAWQARGTCRRSNHVNLTYYARARHLHGRPTSQRLSVTRSHCLGARAAPFAYRTNAVWHVNGTATPTAVLRRIHWVRLPTAAHSTQPAPAHVLCADPTSKDATPRHGTCPKAQVRLAASGYLHTAVALELSAGQARAAGLTRKPERLTTPPPQRHLLLDSLHRAGLVAPSRAEGTARNPGNGPKTISGYRGTQPAQRGGPASRTTHPT